MHPYFYNSNLGLVEKDNIDESRLEIGHDVWIGGGAIITKGCERIGNGAIVAAGAVVTCNIPEFTVWGGVPARKLKDRFELNIIERIKSTEWWNYDLSQLRHCLAYLEVNVDRNSIDQFTEALKEKAD